VALVEQAAVDGPRPHAVADQHGADPAAAVPVVVLGAADDAVETFQSAGVLEG
jgi:hypothetical protein